MGLLSANVIGEIGATFNDLTLMSLVLLALLMIKRAVNIDFFIAKSWVFVLIAGLCFGLATGFKLTTGLYGVGAAVAFLFLKQPIVNNFRILALFFAGGILGFLTANGYWMIVLWRHFGSPIFPYYNLLFKSAYFYPLNLIDMRFLPHGILQMLFYPFYFSHQQLTTEVPFRDFRLPCVYLLLIIAAGKFIFTTEYLHTQSDYPQQEFKKYIIIFFIVSYMLWQFQFSIQRYAIGLDVLAPLLIYILLTNIFIKPRIVNILVLAVFTFLLLTLKPMMWGRARWTHNYFGVQFSRQLEKKPVGIVLSPDTPDAFLRPFFPEKWRFIGIDVIGLDLPFMNSLINNLVKTGQYQWLSFLKIRPILK